jgi:hypothetical protein
MARGSGIRIRSHAHARHGLLGAESSTGSYIKLWILILKLFKIEVCTPSVSKYKMF